MEKNQTLLATANDLSAILNEELMNYVLKSVAFFIDRGNHRISPVKKEDIAYKAWFHVLEKREKFNETKDAKFRTWAVKVAKNYAIDELRKLGQDAMVTYSELEDEEKDSENGHDGHYSRQMYFSDAMAALKELVSGYTGRNRAVAEMLIADKDKSEIMDALQISGGNADVCISRVRKMMRSDMRKAGYSLQWPDAL